MKKQHWRKEQILKGGIAQELEFSKLDPLKVEWFLHSELNKLKFWDLKMLLGIRGRVFLKYLLFYNRAHGLGLNSTNKYDKHDKIITKLL